MGSGTWIIENCLNSYSTYCQKIKYSECIRFLFLITSLRFSESTVGMSLLLWLRATGIMPLDRKVEKTIYKKVWGKLNMFFFPPVSGLLILEFNKEGGKYKKLTLFLHICLWALQKLFALRRLLLPLLIMFKQCILQILSTFCLRS